MCALWNAFFHNAPSVRKSFEKTIFSGSTHTKDNVNMLVMQSLLNKAVFPQGGSRRTPLVYEAYEDQLLRPCRLIMKEHKIQGAERS